MITVLFSFMVLIAMFFGGVALLGEQKYSAIRRLKLLNQELKGSKEIEGIQKDLAALKTRVDGLCFKAGFKV